MEPSSGLPLPVKVSSRNWCDVLPQYVIYVLSSVTLLSLRQIQMRRILGSGSSRVICSVFCFGTYLLAAAPNGKDWRKLNILHEKIDLFAQKILNY
jgi:hypothetical protein